ncbi:MAG: hypothetical protein K9M08_24385 [Pirellula sp.]|nr:hypothetical protein [Pirellula sp.]
MNTRPKSFTTFEQATPSIPNRSKIAGASAGVAHSVEQLSSTVSEASTNFISDKRFGQSFYNRVDYVADRIAEESEIRRGKQFPYQYFAAYLNADLEVPKNIRTSLHNAAEIACGNVPELLGPVVIGLDTS